MMCAPNFRENYHGGDNLFPCEIMIKRMDIHGGKIDLPPMLEIFSFNSIVPRKINKFIFIHSNIVYGLMPRQKWRYFGGITN